MKDLKVTKRVMPGSVIGYVRVSTRRQAEEGNGLEAQLDRMRAIAVANDIRIFELYEDVASASGNRSLGRRGDLQHTIRRAEETGFPILIDRVDRLSRDVSVLKQLLKPGLQIYSVSTRRRVTKKELRDEIRRAQEEASGIALSSRVAHDARRALGRSLKSTLKKEDRRLGTLNNMARAERKDRELADFLRREPEWLDRSMQCLADHLNLLGLLNLVSEREGVCKVWTRAALREPLRRAKERLRLEDEDDFDPFLMTARPDWRGPKEGDAHALPDAHVLIEAALSTPPDPGKSSAVSEEEYYGNHAGYGIF